MDDAADSPAIAGFWRRVGAFAVDGLLLGIIGQILGYFLTGELVDLGPWGRLLGFTIALAYFGLLNSHLANGQTPGKRLLKIRVVSGAGVHLPVAKSFIRFLPLGAAWFLNGIMLPTAATTSVWTYLLSAAIFGLGTSIVYLFVFNRRTRQSLHDLLVDSYVVVASAKVARLNVGVWRGHLIVCAALIAASCLIPYFLRDLSSRAPFESLTRMHAAIAAVPWVANATVNAGRSFTASSQSGRIEKSYVNVLASQKTPDVQNAEHARTLALLALESDGSVGAVDAVQVTLAYGFDIGIASSWRSQTYSHSPAEWRSKESRR